MLTELLVFGLVQGLVNCEDFLETPKFILNKCFCAKNEVVQNDACVDGSPEIPLYNETIQTVERVLKINQFPGSQTYELHCLNNTKETYIYDVAVSFSGNLVDLETNVLYQSGEYCIEFFQNQLLEKPVIFAKVCKPLPRVKIPLCCKRNQVLNQDLECSEERVSFNPPIHALLSENSEEDVYPQCQGSQKLRTIQLSDEQPSVFLSLNDSKVSLVEEGSLLRGRQTVVFRNFCVGHEQNLNETSYLARYCQDDPKAVFEQECQNVTCLKKCCSMDQWFAEDWSCVDHNVDTLPRVFHEFHVVVGGPICLPEQWLLNDKDHNNFSVARDGSLYIEDLGHTYQPGQFCVEMSSDLKHLKAILCDISPDSCSWQNQMTVYLLVISSVFLIITLAVYIGLPDLRAKMSGKCLISELASLFIVFITLALIKARATQEHSVICYLVGSIQHQFTLASFFWLNVMAYDMWKSFRNLLPTNASAPKLKQFVLYSLYGWGCPLVIWCVGWVMDSLVAEGMISKSSVHPGIGEQSCFLNDRRAYWAYLYGFVVVILTINTIFYLHVTFILYTTQKSTEKALSLGNSKVSGHRHFMEEKYWLYLKLFFIMGITWIAEVIAFERKFYSHSCGVWIPFTMMNALRGFLIFVIFVCKKDILAKIVGKLGKARKKTTTYGTTDSSRNNDRISMDQMPSHKK